MKRFWTIVSFIAVVNLLSLIMFVGWLLQSGRLDRDRLLEVRELLAMTPAEAEALADEESALLEVQQTAAAEEERQRNPPLPSSAAIARTSLQIEQNDHALRRLRDETAQHLAELEFRAKQLDERETALEARRRAWETSTADEVRRKTDEQFRKAVRLLEALPGKQAKRMLLELVAQGSLDQAVTYINAMNPRAATKALKELKTDDENRLATQLLERVRTLGIEAEVAESTSNDPAITTPARPDPAGLADSG
ncbi:MAG: hypothetical protein GY715_06980 [Planctomycetes bacterium]|nr:hypothetical protein [Planctomycetota bacterium]